MSLFHAVIFPWLTWSLWTLSEILSEIFATFLECGIYTPWSATPGDTSSMMDQVHFFLYFKSKVFFAKRKHFLQIYEGYITCIKSPLWSVITCPVFPHLQVQPTVHWSYNKIAQCTNYVYKKLTLSVMYTTPQEI